MIAIRYKLQYRAFSLSIKPQPIDPSSSTQIKYRAFSLSIKPQRYDTDTRINTEYRAFSLSIKPQPSLHQEPPYGNIVLSVFQSNPNHWSEARPIN